MTNTTQTGNATFTRNGKTKTMAVCIKTIPGGTSYVRKANGKPFYSTTGYLGRWNGTARVDMNVVHTYRGAVLVTDFVFTADNLSPKTFIMTEVL